MSKVDLTSLEWCELIFKDRNKSYGAYKMRRDLGKRQAAALIIVTVVALVGFTLPRLIRMAMPAQKEEMVEVTRLSTLEEPEIKEEPEEITTPSKKRNKEERIRINTLDNIMEALSYSITYNRGDGVTGNNVAKVLGCLLYTSPSPRD